jgi:hypothetical protein
MVDRVAFKGGRGFVAHNLTAPKPVQTLWATCAAGARSLWAARHNILGYAVNEIFALHPDSGRSLMADTFSTYCF